MAGLIIMEPLGNRKMLNFQQEMARAGSLDIEAWPATTLECSCFQCLRSSLASGSIHLLLWAGPRVRSSVFKFDRTKPITHALSTPHCIKLDSLCPLAPGRLPWRGGSQAWRRDGPQ